MKKMSIFGSIFKVNRRKLKCYFMEENYVHKITETVINQIGGNQDSKEIPNDNKEGLNTLTVSKIIKLCQL